MKKIILKIITILLSLAYLSFSVYTVYGTVTATQKNFGLLYIVQSFSAFVFYLLISIFIGSKKQRYIKRLSIAAFVVSLIPAGFFCLLLSPMIFSTMPLEMLIAIFVPAIVSLLYLICIIVFK